MAKPADRNRYNKKMMITIIIYSHVDKLQTIHDGVQC